MGKRSRAQDMAAPVLTISFSTSAPRVDVGDFFLDIQSMATSPINSKPPSPNPRPSPSASESLFDFLVAVGDARPIDEARPGVGALELRLGGGRRARETAQLAATGVGVFVAAVGHEAAPAVDRVGVGLAGEDGVAGDAHAQSKGRARRVVDDEPFVGGELRLLRVVPGAVVRGRGDY